MATSIGGCTKRRNRARWRGVGCPAWDHSPSRGFVARVERSETRGSFATAKMDPDFAALNPGYLLRSQFDIAMVERERGNEIAKRVRPADAGLTIVARVERSETRGSFARAKMDPDFAALNPGYLLSNRVARWSRKVLKLTIGCFTPPPPSCASPSRGVPAPAPKIARYSSASPSPRPPAPLPPRSRRRRRRLRGRGR
jgi:hypothetical protein